MKRIHERVVVIMLRKGVVRSFITLFIDDEINKTATGFCGLNKFPILDKSMSKIIDDLYFGSIFH